MNTAPLLPTSGEAAAARRLTEGALRTAQRRLHRTAQRGMRPQAPSTALRVVPLPVPGSTA